MGLGQDAGYSKGGRAKYSKKQGDAGRRKQQENANYNRLAKAEMKRQSSAVPF